MTVKDLRAFRPNRQNLLSSPVRRKKILRIILLSLFALLLIGELIARFWVGLGDPPVYRADADFEYIQAPDQDLYRFGRHYLTNEYSMRSAPISDKDEIRILKIGDSVINGGSLTDHDSLATTWLENILSEKYGKRIRVLNISAGSWGPDNAAAYLNRYGDFDARLMVMVYSSHDLFDQMSFDPVVGNHPSFPDEKPLLALWEGFSRYVWPAIFQPKAGADKIHVIGEEGNRPNPGWKFFADYAQERQIPLLVVLHPTTREIKAGEYDANGQRLMKYLRDLGVEVLEELDHKPTAEMYRDDIHYNEAGQRQLVKEVLPWLERGVERLNVSQVSPPASSPPRESP